MFRFFCFCIGLLFSFATSANSVGIVDIEIGSSPKEKTVIFGSDGRVYEAETSNTALINKLKFAKTHKLEVKLQLTPELSTKIIEIRTEQREEIFHIELSSTELDSSLIKGKNFFTNAKRVSTQARLVNTYITDFESEEEVEELFQTQNNFMRFRSECYNRAHIWAWELNKKKYKGKKIQTGKMWIFYTSSYIRRYRFKWWFHIAPYVTVNGQVKILDRTFMDRPHHPNDWVDNLAPSSIRCQEVYKYSSYKDNEQSGNCYFIKSSLYYWQPWQIESAETQNQERSGWVDYELKKAYKDGLGWRSRVP